MGYRPVPIVCDSNSPLDHSQESLEVGACTPLHLAADAGDVAIVSMLLKNGANPRIQVRNRNRVLIMMSVCFADLSLQQALTAGASEQNAVMSTPLHIAASKGNHDVVKALLDAV